MATNTAFGPQGHNVSTTLPDGSTRNRHGVGIDTWVQDCAPGGQNGTVLDAAFFNMLIGNLRTVVNEAVALGAPITVTDGDMNLLYEAIDFIAGNITVTDGLQISGKEISLDIPTLKAMVA